MYYPHRNCGHFHVPLLKIGSFKAIPLLILLFLSPHICTAQVEKDVSSHYNWFDSLIGIENLEMHYGAVYVEKHRSKSKKSKFFPSPYFSPGHVVIDNLPYYSLNLKYNIYEDELLMQAANEFGGKVLKLYKDKINNFTIADHTFIRIDGSEINNDAVDSGFYEVVLEKPPFTLLKRYRRLLKEQLGANLIFYEFEVLDPEFVVHYNTVYHRLKKIGDIKALFPQNTVQLNDFIKNQPSGLSFENQLKSAFLFIDSLWNKEKDKATDE
ncbi:hypothetical protein [Ulvibacterium sp.]|uniref:hypothetical protein n=1 Tax=Ulvibacterium sp. TaxID=2665914 RepID=UPI003CC6C856